ncbi:MAG TPA: hypothetical protein P5556_03170 [Candidatus Gastranaerophilales bacterium]|nr:hypothetical protein [Candidatus Gastranaerophilales bacterium]
MVKKIITLIFALITLNLDILAVKAETNKIIYSDSFDQLYSLAILESENKDTENAFGYFEAIMQKFPDNIPALYSYKSFCIKKGYYDKAIELNKLLYEKTKNDLLPEELAGLYSKKGEIDKTFSIYEDIIAKNPKKTSVKEKLIVGLYEHGEFKKVSTYCKSISTFNKNNKLAMICGKSLFYSGENQVALSIIEKNKLELSARQEELKFISDVYLANNEFSKAIPLIERFNPDKSVYLKLGDLYATTKNHKKSAENYESCLKYEKTTLTYFLSWLIIILSWERSKKRLKFCKS